MNILHSTLSSWRDRLAPISHTSTFRSTGQITPEEFVLAGDYLVYKFPTWSWADASPVSKRVSYLPGGKQFLVTRGVPCHRRLDENFAGVAGQDEAIVQDGFAAGEGGEGDDGWLRTGGLAASQEAKMRDVRTVDESGNVGEKEDEEDEDEIPDMEDEEDDEEAIIRDPKAGDGTKAQVVHDPEGMAKVLTDALAVRSGHIPSTSPIRHTTGLLACTSPDISHRRNRSHPTS